MTTTFPTCTRCRLLTTDEPDGVCQICKREQPKPIPNGRFTNEQLVELSVDAHNDALGAARVDALIEAYEAVCAELDKRDALPGIASMRESLRHVIDWACEAPGGPSPPQHVMDALRSLQAALAALESGHG